MAGAAVWDSAVDPLVLKGLAIADVSSPSTPATIDDSESGTVTSLLGAVTVFPLLSYFDSVVPRADCVVAVDAVASMYLLFLGIDVTENPLDLSQETTLLTSLFVGAKRDRHWAGVR